MCARPQRGFKGAFDRLDRQRRGVLGPRDQLLLLRALSPSLPDAALRYMAVQFRCVDLDGDGSLTAADVMLVGGEAWPAPDTHDGRCWREQPQERCCDATAPHDSGAVQALHAVELRTPEYTYQPGTWFSRGASGRSGGGAGDRDRDRDRDRDAGERGGKREPVIRALDLDTLEHEVRQAADRSQAACLDEGAARHGLVHLTCRIC